MLPEPIPPHLKFRGQKFDEVAAAAGVAPLVVIPCENLHAVAPTTLVYSESTMDGARIAAEIRRDQLFFGVTQNALHRALGGGRNAPFTDSTVAGFSVITVKSTTLTFGVGTRMA